MSLVSCISCSDQTVIFCVFVMLKYLSIKSSNINMFEPCDLWKVFETKTKKIFVSLAAWRDPAVCLLKSEH